MTAIDHYSRFREAKYFSSLDGLRAISILAVIWYHVPELRPIWKTGFLGVHLFFVISGFLITTLLLREKAQYGRISLRNFYLRRTLRIFPAYYLTLGLFFLLCLSVPELRRDGLGTYLHNLPSFLTYTSNWFVNPWGPGRVVFVPAWSLATEEQFYLFWPWIVAFSKKPRTPIIIMTALIVLNEIIKWRVGYWFFLDGYSFPITALNSISPAICMGCLLAFAFDRRRSFEAAWRVFGQRWSAPAFVGLMLLACSIPNDNNLHVFRMFYITLSMAFALAACVIRQDHMLKPLLANRPIRYIGSISYGMYLYHAFGLHFEDRFLAFTKPWPLLEFLAAAGSTVIIASISFWTYERFFLKLKERFTKHRGTQQITPAAVAIELS
ncbi:MAG: acyltransferase [Bacteroidota bacterium]|nr:acyltransferase [Bacteroidota bacterium]MDP4234739.1 acyltransferase [Bacteroidota bacterium]MDP4242631.1 acyltransferase [Bacteroidota bacterium]MDP4286807.1 acyltransferase [Bacteroidota bacterium]